MYAHILKFFCEIQAVFKSKGQYGAQRGGTHSASVSGGSAVEREV